MNMKATRTLLVLLVLATAHGLRRAASDASYALAMIAAFTFLFFCYSATRQRVEPNWPAPATFDGTTEATSGSASHMTRFRPQRFAA